MIRPHALEGSVWTKINDDKIKVNANEIEELFKVEEKAVKSENKEKEQVMVGKNIVLLEGKRVQNISVMLSRFKIPFSHIKEAIEEIDIETLPLDNMLLMKPLLPTEEEIETINNFLDGDGDVALLGAPEKFYIEVMKVNRLHSRFESIIILQEFPGFYLFIFLSKLFIIFQKNRKS